MMLVYNNISNNHYSNSGNKSNSDIRKTSYNSDGENNENGFA